MGVLHEQTRGYAASVSPVVLPFPVPGSDFGMVAALRARHPDAKRALCERYSGELLRLATRLFGPHRCVESIVVQTLNRASTRLADLPNPRALRHWLLTQLIVVARRKLRSQRRWQWIVRRSSSNWFEAARCSEQLVMTYRLLDKLRVEERIVFILVVVHSMGPGEVAEVLGITPHVAKKRLGAAHTKFSQLCQSRYRHLMMLHRSHASLGADIAAEQDRMLGDRRIYESDLRQDGGDRVSLLPFSSRPLAWGLALLPMVVILATAVTALALKFQAVTVRVQGEVSGVQALAPPGKWVVASAQQSKLVSFSDGSSIRLEPGSSIRVVSTTHSGALSALESGSVMLSVAGTLQNEYRIAAGPFDVILTNGQVEIGWDASNELLNLAVHQGSVTVSRCQFGSGNSVVAGMTLQARCLAP